MACRWIRWCRWSGSNRHSFWEHDFESCASANSATPAGRLAIASSRWTAKQNYRRCFSRPDTLCKRGRRRNMARKLTVQGVASMNEETLNMSLRKFLKVVGVTSQQEIEKAIRAAVADGRLKGTETIGAQMVLTIGKVGLTHK